MRQYIAKGVLVAVIDDHPASGYAVEFAQHAHARSRVHMHHETDADHAVERISEQWQRLGIGLHVTADRALLAVRNGGRLLEHLQRDVAAHHFESFARQRAGEAAGTTGQIQEGAYTRGLRQRLADGGPFAHVALLALRRTEA